MINEKIVVFDIETTGINPAIDKITEIGGVKIENGEVIDIFSELINPEINIPARITEITGIDDEMVKDKPTIREVLPSFIEFCDTEYILGHNITFDYKFIKTNAIDLKQPFEKKAYDTLELSRKLLKHLPSRSLDNLCEYYSIDRQRAHRAFEDAKATFRLFNILIEEYYKENKDIFVPKQLMWKPQKQSPITPKQKKYLLFLTNEYNVVIEKDVNDLTKNEASRIIDKILSRYGKVR